MIWTAIEYGQYATDVINTILAVGYLPTMDSE